jgi:hypothetical protein
MFSIAPKFWVLSLTRYIKGLCSQINHYNSFPSLVNPHSPIDPIIVKIALRYFNFQEELFLNRLNVLHRNAFMNQAIY